MRHLWILLKQVHFDELPMLFFTYWWSRVVMFYWLTVERPHFTQPSELFSPFCNNVCLGAWQWSKLFLRFQSTGAVMIPYDINESAMLWLMIWDFLRSISPTLLAHEVNIHAVGWHCQIELFRCSFQQIGYKFELATLHLRKVNNGCFLLFRLTRCESDETLLIFF